MTPVNLVGLGPNGATLRCRDGSYPAPFSPDAACAASGGVLVRFRTRGVPPPPRAKQGPRPPPPAVATAPALVASPSRANVRIDPPPVPAGATLVCNDGTYIVADTSSTRCAAHQGVKLRLRPARRR